MEFSRTPPVRPMLFSLAMPTAFGVGLRDGMEKWRVNAQGGEPVLISVGAVSGLSLTCKLYQKSKKEQLQS